MLVIFLVTQLFAAEPTIDQLNCYLQKPEQKNQLVVKTNFKKPFAVVGELIKFSERKTAQIDVTFEGDLIVSNSTATCSRTDVSHGSELICTWEPTGYNRMRSDLRLIPEITNGQFAGTFRGDVFISTYGRFGLESRNLVTTVDESLLCDAK
jgi:hypothetical protein